MIAYTHHCYTRLTMLLNYMKKVSFSVSNLPVWNLSQLLRLINLAKKRKKSTTQILKKRACTTLRRFNTIVYEQNETESKILDRASQRHRFWRCRWRWQTATGGGVKGASQDKVKIQNVTDWNGNRTSIFTRNQIKVRDAEAKNNTYRINIKLTICSYHKRCYLMK